MFRFFAAALTTLSISSAMAETPLSIDNAAPSLGKNTVVSTIDLSTKHQTVGQRLHHDVSIASVDIQLAGDYDHDGYFSKIDVRFDADSYYDEHWLYAELVLSDGISDYHYHTSDDFVIYGHASYDQFGVETTLDSGFYPTYYEVTILLYDAFSHELLAVVDTANHYNVQSLALESLDYGSGAPVYHHPNRPTVHSHEYGGSLSWAFSTLLVICFLLRVNRRSLF